MALVPFLGLRAGGRCLMVTNSLSDCQHVTVRLIHGPTVSILPRRVASSGLSEVGADPELVSGDFISSLLPCERWISSFSGPRMTLPLIKRSVSIKFLYSDPK